MLDPTRTYLEAVLPWPPHGDPNAYFNLHWPTTDLKTQGPDAGRPFWDARACTSVEEMLQLIQALNQGRFKKAAGDVYVCMSSQRIMEVKTYNGRDYRVGKKSQGGVVQLRSLFLDIDVKADKGYASQRDALLALKEFRTAVGLPAPTLHVSSGTGGIHAYWVLSECLTREEWQPLANALAAAARQHGLKFDSQCTIDSARVLRVPGTRNTKPGGTQVQILGGVGDQLSVTDAHQILAPFKGLTHLGNTPASLGIDGQAPTLAVLNAGANRELGAGVERESRPVILPTVAPDCAFFADAYATGGAAHDNPLWNLAVLATTFAEDGLAQAHALSKGHPDYDPAAVEALYARKVKERETNPAIGWPSCQSISLTGCASCATCPHFSAGKSPLHFAKRANLPFSQQDPDLPDRAGNGALYARGADGRIWVIDPEAEPGEPDRFLVCEYPLTDGWLQDNPWTLHFATRVGNRKATVQLATPELQGRDWTKLLAQQGVDIPLHHRTHLQGFLVAWINKLKSTPGGVVSTNPYGWVLDENQIVGFSYGGVVHTPTGTRPTASADPVIERQYRPKGDITPWKEAATMITDQGRPALEAILACAFGAPLMRFTGENGVIVSAYSKESGIGKSTAIKVAQSVWGDPIKAVQSLTDTNNSVIGKVGVLRSLPMFWDEMKGNEQASKFVDIAFNVTQGKEKSRMTANVTQRDPGVWQTLLLAASNDSLAEVVARQSRSAAGHYRVLEFVVEPALTQTAVASDVARMVLKLHDNFGQPGLVFADYLGANFEDIDSAVGTMQRHIAASLNTTPDERFWVAGVAAMLVGAEIANDLGLTAFNIEDLAQFLLKTVETMREQLTMQSIDLSRATSIEDILAQYLKDVRATNYLETNKIHSGKGKPAGGSITPQNDTSRLQAVNVQLGKEDNLLRFSQSHFSKWIVDNRMGSVANITGAMKAQWGMTAKNASLGSGTIFATNMKEWLWEIDLTKIHPVTDGGK
jgi:hypothetical protein